MLGLLGKIFGSEKVISKSLDLIDSFHTSTEEQIEASTRSKVALLEAYAPFKLAQRIIAFSFTFIYLSCFGLVLGYTLFDQVSDADKVKQVLEDFQIGYAMLIILAFYFGGGAAEGILQNRQRRE